MKELLRVVLLEQQVREACRAYAQAKAVLDEPHSIDVKLINGNGQGLRCEVTFSRKRVRKVGAK